MNTSSIDPSFAIKRKPHTRALIRNSAGQIIFDCSVGRNWRGYIVREIQEIRDGDDATPSSYRNFTGTCEIVLEGVGGVRYTLSDNQDPLLTMCLKKEREKNAVIDFVPSAAAILCFNDNVAEFYD